MAQPGRKARAAQTPDPSASGAGAARSLLRPRLDAAARLVRRASAEDHAPADIHQLRVATRRATAALEALAPLLPDEPRLKALKRLRKLRRAGAQVRDCDVHLDLFGAIKPSTGDERAAIRALRRATRAERDNAWRALRDEARKSTPARLLKLRRALVDDAPDPDAAHTSLSAVARLTLPVAVDSLRADLAAGVSSFKALHDLRISAKKCRYTLEVFGPALGDEAERLAEQLKDLQARLGAINDFHVALERVHAFRASLGRAADDRAAALRPGVASLARRLEDSRRRARADFLAWWRDQDPKALLRALDRLTSSSAEAARTNGRAHAPARAPERSATLPPLDPAQQSARLAAIDIGSNSVRLIIAEAQRDGAYRVLDDEKEQVRLGRGLATTGSMKPDAIARTIEVVTKMKSIAEGYAVDAIRMIATAAVREADNGADLAGPLEARTGLPLHVISAEEEGKLAYESAAHHFDLSGAPAAVMDIGGGSMEVVLSSGAAIEHTCSMPLGAVRLTERFGGPEAVATTRFDEMRAYIDGQLEAAVGKPPFVPQVLIGAGGTVSTLANISLHQRRPEGDLWLSAAGVRGHEMLRSEVRHLLDYLRKLPLRDRARTPGLPAERADIIVAGLAAVERLMKKLGVNRVRVHDGGIREGIILRMIKELLPGSSAAPEPRDPLAAARKFGAACSYEERHCNHVAALAGRIFDQLAARAGAPAPGPRSAPPPWTDPRNRTLLEAASLLKDVGYHINYSKHHHHSYHLIMHGEFRGLPARDIEIIANIARYHRRAEPKAGHPNFAKLPPADRDLVRRLSAILRIADGLDRTHMGAVRDATLVVAAGEALFILDAPASPSVDIWGAERKAGLFEKVFNLKARFDWAQSAVDDKPPAAAPLSASAEPLIATGPARKPALRARTHSARRAPARARRR